MSVASVRIVKHVNAVQNLTVTSVNIVKRY